MIFDRSQICLWRHIAPLLRHKLKLFSMIHSQSSSSGVIVGQHPLPTQGLMLAVRLVLMLITKRLNQKKAVSPTKKASQVVLTSGWSLRNGNLILQIHTRDCRERVKCMRTIYFDEDICWDIWIYDAYQKMIFLLMYELVVWRYACTLPYPEVYGTWFVYMPLVYIFLSSYYSNNDVRHIDGTAVCIVPVE